MDLERKTMWSLINIAVWNKLIKNLLNFQFSAKLHCTRKRKRTVQKESFLQQRLRRQRRKIIIILHDTVQRLFHFKMLLNLSVQRWKWLWLLFIPMLPVHSVPWRSARSSACSLACSFNSITHYFSCRKSCREIAMSFDVHMSVLVCVILCLHAAMSLSFGPTVRSFFYNTFKFI